MVWGMHVVKSRVKFMRVIVSKCVVYFPKRYDLCSPVVGGMLNLWSDLLILSLLCKVDRACYLFPVEC